MAFLIKYWDDTRIDKKGHTLLEGTLFINEAQEVCFFVLI